MSMTTREGRPQADLASAGAQAAGEETAGWGDFMVGLGSVAADAATDSVNAARVHNVEWTVVRIRVVT
jgi:hypothetical protein